MPLKVKLMGGGGGVNSGAMHGRLWGARGHENLSELNEPTY